MSFRDKRWLWILAATALLARGAVALVTEHHPVFPEHYYTDSKLYDAEARAHVEALLQGEAAPFSLTPGRELYTYWVVLFYYFFGPCALVLKLLNCVFGALSVLIWYFIAERLSREGGQVRHWNALGVAAVLAFWPTHVFYTSQNLKESFMLLSLSGCFYAFLSVWMLPDRLKPDLWTPFKLICGILLLFLSGLLRAHIVPMIVAAVLFGGVWKMAKQPQKSHGFKRNLLVCASVLLVLGCFRFSAARILRIFESYEPRSRVPFVSGLITMPVLETTTVAWTPRWVSDFRKIRQQSDQKWTLRNVGRSINTQLFTDVEFRTWTDIIVFLPKGAFYTLFMPLPGLYPMQGNLGRILASMENMILLGVFVLALMGFFSQGHPPCGEDAAFIAFFVLFWTASALTEVDLGSATRHRLIYFPFILPFAMRGMEQCFLMVQQRLNPRKTP